MSKFKVNDSVLWKGNTRQAEATVVSVTPTGYEVYEWDRKIRHPATEESLSRILTFKDAEQMVRQALVGTIYENADLTEYGGGDGTEDIKPFLIDTKGGIDLGATVYPEGGMLFWTWPEDGNQDETENAADAIAAFQKATDNK